MAASDRSSNLQWFDRDSNLLNSIDSSILSITANYSMDMCAQLTVQVHDPNFDLAKSNYFSPTRDVIYESFAVQDFGANNSEIINSPTTSDTPTRRIQQRFEIAVAEVSSGPGTSAIWNLELRTKAIQQMKRDRDPGSIKGNGSDYARQAAEKYGLIYFIQNTKAGKQITKASSTNRADSTWDVLTRLASEAKFVIFEMNGYLVFCSQKFLLGKWGSESMVIRPNDPIMGISNSANPDAVSVMYIPVSWPSPNNSIIKLVEMPSMRQSDNDPLEASGSLTVDRLNGTSLRPGMTIFLKGIPMFEKLYLISSVTYDHFSTDPVRVEIRTPEREEKEIRDFVIGSIPQDSVIGWSPQAFLPSPTRANNG